MTSVQTDERHDTPRIPQAAKFDRRQVADRQQRTQFPNIRLGEKIMGSPHGSLPHFGQLFEIVRSDLYNAHLSMIKYIRRSLIRGTGRVYDSELFPNPFLRKNLHCYARHISEFIINR